METVAAARLNGKLSPIQRGAFAWVELLASGHASDEDMVALERWRKLSPSHDEAFVAAVKIRELVGRHRRTPDDTYRTPFLERASTRRAALTGGALLIVAGAGYGITRIHRKVDENLIQL